MDEPRHFGSSGLDLFWEQADVEAIGDHPLRRELEHRLDALARYRDLIADAQTGGREHLVRLLMAEHDREEEMARRLQAALFGDSGAGGG